MYTCGVNQLSYVDELVDLGVMRSNSSAVNYQTSAVISKTNKVAGLILRTFHTRDASVLWRAFSTYVSPILMYASQCWSPKLCRDIVACENVQRYFSKRLFGLHGLSYIERLQHLHISSLETSRTFMDVLFAYRITHGIYVVSVRYIGLLMQGGVTRGSRRRLVILLFHNAAAKSFYKFWLPSIWNAMPQSTLFITNFRGFKRAVHEHFMTHSF